jgi:di/tricarboxylate transporter
MTDKKRETWLCKILNYKEINGTKIPFSMEVIFLILGTAYSANIGGVITMIASPPNAIGAAVLGLSLTFQ